MHTLRDYAKAYLICTSKSGHYKLTGTITLNYELQFYKSMRVGHSVSQCKWRNVNTVAVGNKKHDTAWQHSSFTVVILMGEI